MVSSALVRLKTEISTERANMKALVIGLGNIGAVAAHDLVKTAKKAEITVADSDPKRAKNVAASLGTEGIQLDVTNTPKLEFILKDYDLALGFLPAAFAYRLMESCVKTRTDLVDVSFIAENPLALNAKAEKANVTIVPDCGLAPGISNVLVGHAISQLDHVESVKIMVGGLPEIPLPPLEYTITWSPDSLIDEYTRKARVIRKGKRVERDAFAELEMVDFPGIGKLEAFLTDGLRNLMDMVKAENMSEKTLRYPGHAEKIMLLKSLGLFEEKPFSIEGVTVTPRKLTARLFSEKLSQPEMRDVVALKVEVAGTRGNNPARHVFTMLDTYDRKAKVTAMARTTAYPASIVAQQLIKGDISDKGVVPPEILGMNPRLFKDFTKELHKRGVSITEENE